MTPPPGRAAAGAPGLRHTGPAPRRAPGRRSRGQTPAARADDRRRTFPAPQPLADDRTAATWWGHAWVAALESAALDPARLARGRTYAGRGRVDGITVTPGRVTAYVQGSRARPYRTEIRLRALADDIWEEFLTAAAARPEHVAALLDKDLPRDLVHAADLLPAAGDLIPDCSCPDDGFPCKHAAALCYQTARLLDEDPFVLFLLRGRGERDLLAELTHRHTAPGPAARPQVPQATVPAHTALARRRLPVLPPPFPPPAHPGRPPAYPQAPGAPDPMALDLLAGESAVRAHALLTGGADPVAGLTVWQDAVRLAAAHPGSGLTASTRALYRELAAATGRTPTELARAVAAWRQGGRAALAVLEEPWDPPAGPFDRARPALAASDVPDLPAVRPRRNRLTGAAHQLRFGRDGLWYGYESDPGKEDWWPRGTPDGDPVRVLTALLGR
ncbi:SWIM zinc finger family protein [Streptomyces yaizuensis]|uniref:SWIM zinc finger family protein n=1 Tax=Streptomyces yaizuensis TaxID=2989713 RepID=A0ABQ5P7K5_9ACTN|nr:SWIM zinc finger family protein [Streptomyces sp. YSPA8]GLF98568.1 SWIM zinc finger family protein [Streptomyces sp. YSPA8]